VPAPAFGEWITAALTALLIVALLTGVTLGYLYAVEAAATGGIAIACYGIATRTLTRAALAGILRDTMALSGALFAVLIGATVFTLIVRGFGTDRLIADWVSALAGDPRRALVIVLMMLAVCALVLDAYEMIFVVIPILMPPLLTRIPDATWVAVLTLLVLQTSFLVPPIGYAVLMVRHRLDRPVRTLRLVRALSPYLVVQLLVLALVVAFPAIVWRGPAEAETRATQPPPSFDESVPFDPPPPDFDEGESQKQSAGEPASK
jgi:TRAP-type mannitol/chloroaromatic compound transport system permease large subunit